MPRACDLKKGNVVEINSEAYMVKHIDVRSPSARGAVTLYKIRFSNIKTKQKYEESYKGNDMLNEVALQRRSVQYLYPDGALHVFMDSQEYSQYMIESDAIEDELIWITDGMEGLVALIIDENMVSIEIPKALIFEISKTAPGIKGASASARTKPATLSNGVEIQIPEYLEAGEMVKVNTETKKIHVQGVKGKKTEYEISSVARAFLFISPVTRGKSALDPFTFADTDPLYDTPGVYYRSSSTSWPGTTNGNRVSFSHLPGKCFDPSMSTTEIQNIE